MSSLISSNVLYGIAINAIDEILFINNSFASKQFCVRQSTKTININEINTNLFLVWILFFFFPCIILFFIFSHINTIAEKKGKQIDKFMWIFSLSKVLYISLAEFRFILYGIILNTYSKDSMWMRQPKKRLNAMPSQTNRTVFPIEPEQLYLKCQFRCAKEYI